jgi:phosphoglycolate phosphatase
VQTDHIEILNPALPRGHLRHALFDFDGTISLIRQGWQQVMVPLMVEVLGALKTSESEAELSGVVTEFVDRLTGKQTIYQMRALCDAVRVRGGTPLDAAAYKRIYLDRLWNRISGRVAALAAGEVAPDAWMVPGAAGMLAALRARGVICYLASGTDEPDVNHEARALGVADYFAEIHGARDNDPSSSKKQIIARILQEHDLRGEELCVFGDGFVEIEEAKAAGGGAVGVATDEVALLAARTSPGAATGADPWKRDRLARAGADLIVPDFCAYPALIAYLFAEEAPDALSRL